MAVWATSNREASLKAEVLFDITCKVEWRSDLDFVRCVKQIYNLSSNVSRGKCQSHLFTQCHTDRVAEGKMFFKGPED